jgi:hypothetical protein
MLVGLFHAKIGAYMIFERQAFLRNFSDVSKDILLIPEYGSAFGTPCKCQFFTNRAPLEWDEPGFKNQFWAWVKANMRGEVRVFASDEDSEWIGFTNYKDAFEFILSW